MKGSEDISKEQQISMIHFLEKRDDEPTNEARAESNYFELCLARRRSNAVQSKKENEEFKALIKELQETHNQKVKSQADLLASFNRLTRQVADLTQDNKKLQQRIDELLKQI